MSRTELRRPEGVIVALLAVLVAVAGCVYCASVAGGSDAFGYLSQVDLWLEGQLRFSQPWASQVPWPMPEKTFTPLGYRPLQHDGSWSWVPVYSAGLPMLMASFKGLAGNTAMFAVVPLSGALLVGLTYL